MATLTVEIVTGERMVYQDSGVELVSAPGAEGQLGILPNHASLMSMLDAGELRIRKGGRDEHFVIFGGFIEVRYNRVVILADTAERATDIDIARAQRARDRAAEALQNRADRASTVEAEAALRRAALRLRVGSQTHHGGRSAV